MSITAQSQKAKAVFRQESLAPGTLLIGMLVMLTVIIGTEKLACLYAGAVLLIALNLLWRPGESQVLLFVVLCQWMQASVKVFEAAFSEKGLIFFRKMAQTSSGLPILP
jgi:hypothetical protein